MLKRPGHRLIGNALSLLFACVLCVPSVSSAHASNGTWQQFTYNGPAGSRPYFFYTRANYQVGTAVPLVVMLHGCTQTPADFAAGTQMDALADQKQFIVVYPQQTSTSNASDCWNWFVPADQARGSGEPAIIAGITQTVEGRTGAWTIDTQRVYVAGFSAGAAMAVIVGATYALFDSSHNTVSNNTANYPYTMNYLVTDGSSYNTLNTNQGTTGDFVGLLVADPLPGTATLQLYGPSHDNLIENITIQSDGPTGNEINRGVAPAFLGGLVVLNGTYNTMRDNQVFISTGSDLAWAQAVPNSSTPIGVDNYPPTLHCNVSASEGGGGTANHNGNVWTGNAAKIIDPCIPAQ